MKGDPLERVHKASDRVDKLAPRLASARKELHEAVVEAHRAGHSLAVVASVAHLSRERVRQIVEKAQGTGPV